MAANEHRPVIIFCDRLPSLKLWSPVAAALAIEVVAGDESDGFFSLSSFSHYLLLLMAILECLRKEFVLKTSHFRHLPLPIPHTVVSDGHIEPT
jgi:hypothetical protein